MSVAGSSDAAKDGGLYTVALRAIAVLLVTPPTERAGSPGVTRRQLKGRLEGLSATRVGSGAAGTVGLEKHHHTKILELLERTQGLLELVGNQRLGEDHDPSSKCWTRTVQQLQLPPVDSAQASEHADALCWLVAGLHREATDRDLERLRLPASVTGLVRLLAAVVAEHANLGLAALVLRRAELGDLSAVDAEAAAGVWPPVYLQALPREQLGRGRPPAARWPVVRAGLLRILAGACSEARRCTITYASPTTGRTHDIELDPWFLVVRRGFWYLVGQLDHDRRVFRLERILAVQADSPGSRQTTPNEALAEQALRFDVPGPVPAETVRHTTEVPPPPGSDEPDAELSPGEDKPSRWSVPARSYALSDWAMDSPGGAEVVTPAGLRKEIAAAANRIAERHSVPPSQIPDPQPPADLPGVRDVENEQQLLTLCTVLAWHHAREMADIKDLDRLVGWLLGFAGDDTGPVEQLDLLADRLKTASQTYGCTFEPLPIVALDADERLAVSTVLNRAVRLPLPEEVARQLAALATWLEPLLNPARLLLEPTSPGEGETALWGPALAAAQRDQDVVTVRYRARDGTVEQRVVSPWWFAAAPRYDYLRGYDHDRNEPRWLRLDRVLGVIPAAHKYQRPPTKEAMPVQAPTGIAGPCGSTVRLLLEPRAWWLLDELSVDCWPQDAGGGAITVEVNTDTSGYLHRLVLRGKGNAELLEPADDRAMVAALAREVAQRHG